MTKPKIVQIESEDYTAGRIDSFGIKIESDLNCLLIPLFTDLGFLKEEVLEKLDVAFEGLKEGYYTFIYGNKNIKAHLIIETNVLLIKVDTTETREKINKIFSKYFDFPK